MRISTSRQGATLNAMQTSSNICLGGSSLSSIRRAEMWMQILFQTLLYAICLFMLLLLSHFSRVRLCVTPIDGSPPGSGVPGILQARTLEWVAISFSTNCLFIVWSDFHSTFTSYTFTDQTATHLKGMEEEAGSDSKKYIVKFSLGFLSEVSPIRIVKFMTLLGRYLVEVEIMHTLTQESGGLVFNPQLKLWHLHGLGNSLIFFESNLLINMIFILTIIMKFMSSKMDIYHDCRVHTGY